MTDHDQRGCLRCGNAAGDQGFCEPCHSQFDSARGNLVSSSALAAREVRLEQGAEDRGSEPARPPERLTTEPLEAGKVSTGDEERFKAPREVARLEEVLTRKEVDPELAACLQADAAGAPEGATNLGVLLEQRGDLEGALAAYRRAERRGDVNGSFNLGCLLAEMGDLPGARAALGRADERGDASAASNLGVLLERQKDLDGAVAAYRRGDERGDAFAAFNLGLLLAARGDLAGARAAYRRAAERGDPEVRERAAQAAAELVPDESVPASVPEPPGEEPQVGVPEAEPRGSHERSRTWWIAALCILGVLALATILTRRRRR